MPLNKSPVDVQLQELNRDGLVARLRDNLDDRVFMANPLVLVAPAGHRLAGADHVALADLQGARFVLRERGSGTRIAADAHFKRLGFVPQVRLELGSNEAVKESVAGKLGGAVLSVHALASPLAPQGVVVLPVQGFPIPSQWHVVRRRTRPPSPIAQAFADHLLMQAAAMQVAG